jgi:hypothetical protein
MPIGLTNVSATFQSLMIELFRPYLWKFILVFFMTSLCIQNHRKTTLHICKLYYKYYPLTLYLQKKKNVDLAFYRLNI